MARQVPDQTGYAPGYNDPVRAVNPYTPSELVTTGQAPSLPIVGLLVLAGVVYWLEHRRRRRSR